MFPDKIITKLDEIASDIKTVKEAVDLLQSVYVEYGPYRNGEITQETWNKVRNFFKFDDSE